MQDQTGPISSKQKVYAFCTFGIILIHILFKHLCALTLGMHKYCLFGKLDNVNTLIEGKIYFYAKYFVRASQQHILQGVRKWNVFFFLKVLL